MRDLPIHTSLEPVTQTGKMIITDVSCKMTQETPHSALWKQRCLQHESVCHKQTVEGLILFSGEHNVGKQVQIFQVLIL